VGAVAAGLPSGQILIAGGGEGFSGPGSIVSSAELFGPPTQIAGLVSCTMKGKHCTTKHLKSPATISENARVARAALARAGRLYATGRLTRTRGALGLVLDLVARRTLNAGSYTLSLRWKTGKTTHSSRQRIRIE
jgi:hypothetical protein